MDERWRLAKKERALRIRAAMIQTIRLFFVTSEFLEVETPLRVPELAPESHIDAVRSGKYFLQTSPELCMKRLLAAGYSRLFQISKCFRRGERGGLHLPEFTMLEWYEAGADYRGLMDRCEDLIIYTARRLGMNEGIPLRDGRTLSLEKPWERLDLSDAFRRYGSLSLRECLDRDCFEEVLTGEIEPNLGRDRPTFLYDYPVSLGSLARRKDGDGTLTERCELYLDGIELANGFSELNDAGEQRRRFEEEQHARKERGQDAYPEPRRFLASLSHMPESAGIALGVDRLAMLFSGVATIDEVVTFTPEELLGQRERP
ncbi:MAG: EF-P lysine aminoacylase EpmA [Syntrophales bacterium]|nr:EF-P lysine aminoacylase EpmA [Syntrophales bacterium]MCK9527394.1 EF-P lysine aminoacylase EpmA [Syntrophales bacterium]MDX9921496.1 EF-P lysine aminoacylase EpmA [Syntrophales bacterium]